MRVMNAVTLGLSRRKSRHGGGISQDCTKSGKIERKHPQVGRQLGFYWVRMAWENDIFPMPLGGMFGDDWHGQNPWSRSRFRDHSHGAKTNRNGVMPNKNGVKWGYSFGRMTRRKERNARCAIFCAPTISPIYTYS